MKRENRESLNKKAQDHKLSNKEAEKQIRALLDKAQKSDGKK